MICQTEAVGRSNSADHHHARRNGESESRASLSSKFRRITELEDELDRLRISTKAALEQSWDETERLQRTSAEKDEEINSLRCKLVETEDREQQWRRKYKEVHGRLLSQSRASSPSVLNREMEGEFDGEIQREIEHEIEQQNEITFQAMDYYGMPIDFGYNDEQEDALSEELEAPEIGDVGNRSLFRTIRRSIGSTMQNIGVAASGDEDWQNDGDECSWLEDSWAPPQHTGSRPPLPPPGRLPPRPERKPLKRHCSAPPGVTTTGVEGIRRGNADPVSSTGIFSSWHHTEIRAPGTAAALPTLHNSKVNDKIKPVEIDSCDDPALVVCGNERAQLAEKWRRASAPEGDVGNRHLFRTLRKSITMFGCDDSDVKENFHEDDSLQQQEPQLGPQHQTEKKADGAHRGRRWALRMRSFPSSLHGECVANEGEQCSGSSTSISTVSTVSMDSGNCHREEPHVLSNKAVCAEKMTMRGRRRTISEMFALADECSAASPGLRNCNPGGYPSAA